MADIDKYLRSGSVKTISKPFKGTLALSTGVLKTITPSDTQKVVITSLLIAGTGSFAGQVITIKSNGVSAGEYTINTDGSTSSKDNIGYAGQGYVNPEYIGGWGEEITLENLTGSNYLYSITYLYVILEKDS